jgi:CBS domain containing-hemolysin-like protein
MTTNDILLRLSLILFLILLNAFFVTAEFSIVSVRRSRIIQLVESGDILAQTVQSLQRSLDRLLSTTQLGITLSSLALGWIGESTMANLVKNCILRLPLSARSANLYSHALSIPIAFFIIAYLQIVLGELCPKSVALIYAEKLAKLLAVPIGVISQVFNPFIWILNQSTRFLLSLIGIRSSDTRWHDRVTPQELQLIISTDEVSMGLENDQREIINNIFEFQEVTAEEIMIPRTQIAAVAKDATFQTLLEEISVSGYSRYPVKGDSLDDIKGIINFKDLALSLAQGKITPDTSLQSWLKPINFYPESTPLSELLAIMQRSNIKMVMIVDEYGGTSGLVTLQDLIAEILGNESDITNSQTIEFQVLDEHTFLVEAQMNLEEVNEFLDLDLPVTDEYQTLGGFLLYQLQKIPHQGEIYNYDNLEFTIVAAQGPRLTQIRIHRKELIEESECMPLEAEDSISEENINSEP